MGATRLFSDLSCSTLLSYNSNAWRRTCIITRIRCVSKDSCSPPHLKEKRPEVAWRKSQVNTRTGGRPWAQWPPARRYVVASGYLFLTNCLSTCHRRIRALASTVINRSSSIKSNHAARSVTFKARPTTTAHSHALVFAATNPFQHHRQPQEPQPPLPPPVPATTVSCTLDHELNNETHDGCLSIASLPCHDAVLAAVAATTFLWHGVTTFIPSLSSKSPNLTQLPTKVNGTPIRITTTTKCRPHCEASGFLPVVFHLTVTVCMNATMFLRGYFREVHRRLARPSPQMTRKCVPRCSWNFLK